VGRGDDVSAKHVAAGLMERGTQGVLQLIAALDGTAVRVPTGKSARPKTKPAAKPESDPEGGAA
jgi:hypothetical protein